ncbi:MAG TPA: YceI family protein [Cytophagaceae bacterium]
MKLKHIIFGVLATGLIYSCNEAPKEQQASVGEVTEASGVETKYTVNVDSSVVNWKGTMLNMYSHNGSLKLVEGSLILNGDQISGGSFVADLKTINPLDDGYSPERPKEGLVAHLQKADFFATDSFPTASFVIKSVEGNTIIGDLTVRDKTNEEKVTDVVVTKEGNIVKASGKLVFNRQKYDVSYKASMKDMVLSDDIELEVELVGEQQ